MDKLLLDRLYLLNYRNNFCAPRNLKPLDPGFFNAPNPNSHYQITYFYALFAWLANLSGDSFRTPGEMDDPNVVISDIVQLLKDAKIQTDINPLSLKQGYGETVLNALISMSDRALKSTGYVFKPPVFHDTDEFEEAETNDDAEVKMETVEEMLDLDSDEKEEEFSSITRSFFSTPHPKSNPITSPTTTTTSTTITNSNTSNGLRRTKSNLVMMPTLSPQEWKEEVERVLPQLKVHLLNDHKDWKLHVTQLNQHANQLHSTFNSQTNGSLIKLTLEIETMLEKIQSREKYIHSHFETLVDEYKCVQQGLSKLKQTYTTHTDAMSTLSNDLAHVSEKLDAVKAQMDDLGSGMTDSKPLIQIKSTLQRLKTEIKQMNIRIGVLEHTLLHMRIKNKANLVTGNATLPSFIHMGV